MIKYVIVQAGGKGTRLGYLTKNKPKALTPIENLPMIFHLFRKFPDKRFVIIADYKRDVLRHYLSAFCDVKYQVVDAVGEGTCSGLSQAIDLIPANEKFLLVWSDLILPSNLVLPDEYETADLETDTNYIGLSQTFPCRWKYENGVFFEEKSIDYGVAGFFLFSSKRILESVPESGELVRWMQQKRMTFETIGLAGTREFGILEEYEKFAQSKTRPFNKITINGEALLKEPLDDQGKALAKYECAWYEMAKKKDITGIPKIYGTSPLEMEYIHGKNIYECNYNYETKKRILESLVNTLNKLHSVSCAPGDSFSVKEAYYNKTMKRLSLIEDLVPFAREKTICINGKVCRNVFFHSDELEKKLQQLRADKFCFIHGDCTFSNLMIRDTGEPVLIDPRGYFGFTDLYGDVRYDWAKLYYSIVGNYDQFNLKHFDLDIGGQSVVNGKIIDDLDEGEVRLKIESNGWEDMEDDYFRLTSADEYEIKLLHAIIWLSLTTYAWQDYDSICGAFYNGLYYLEDVL